MEISFLEAVRVRIPRHRHLLEALGELYTEVGRYEDGLAVDLQLSREHPRDAEVWYNLGCSYALTGRKMEALSALARAVDLGFDDRGLMAEDIDLDSLRDDPQFRSLVTRVRARHGAGQGNTV